MRKHWVTVWFPFSVVYKTMISFIISDILDWVTCR